MNLLDLEGEKFKTVKIRGFNFKIRFMSPEDMIRISQKRMALAGGNPISAMTEAEYLHIESIAIVDICVEELPKEFNANESSLKWEDKLLIYELAEEIRRHTADIESRLKKNRPTPGSAEG